MSRCAHLVVVVSLLVSATASFAIVCNPACEPDPTDTTYAGAFLARTTPQNHRGRHPIHTPIPTGDVGPLTLASASYNYAAPILSLPGRNGLNLNLTLYYNSRIWDVDNVNGTATFNTDLDFPSYGFRLGFGYIEKNGTQYVLTESDGSKRELVLSTSPTYITTDSSNIDFNSTTKVLRYRNGVQVLYEVFPTSNDFLRPTKITDTNGNYISIAYVTHVSNVNDEQNISTITDTLGRVVTFTYNANATLYSITQGTKVYAVFNWNTSYTFKYNFASGITAVNSPNNNATLTVLSGLIYANSTFVNFVYGDWGVINEIQSKSSSAALRSSTSYNIPAATTALTDAPGFTQQTVSDGASSYVTTHTVAKTAGNKVATYTITDPGGVKSVSTLYTAGGWQDGLVTKVEVRDSSDVVLRTTTNVWDADGSNRNPKLAQVFTRLNDTNQLAKTEFCYDTNGNILGVAEYDFGFPRLRYAATSYLSTSAYTTKHILDRPSSVKVYQGGSLAFGVCTIVGSLVARTDFTYDGGPLSSVTGASHHDDTNYGSGLTTRGNVSSITRYANASAGTGGISRSFSYDTLGNLISADADCCSKLEWVYSSTTQYAYPDQVKRGPSGSQLITSATYDFASGLVLTSTDENSKTTTLTYDSVDRISTSTPPSPGAVATVTYDDSSAQPSVLVTNTGNSAEQKTITDGLGRTVQSQLRNSGTALSLTDYTYDSAGRLYQVSNPRASGDSPVYTSRAYDGYNRLTSVTPPGSVGAYTYSYSGNSSTATDPAGKARRSFSDAAGRLVEVDEPGFGDGAAGRGFVTVVRVGTGSGNVTMTVNGLAKTTSYTGTTLEGTVASGIASAFTADGTSSVYAVASGSTVYFTAKTAAASTNYTLSSSVTGTGYTTYNSGTTLTGGVDASPGTNTLASPMVTTYSYDQLNDLLQVNQGAAPGLSAQTRTFVYDSLGRLTSATPAESNGVATTYTYTDFSAVYQRTDPRNVVTTYGYDTSNRISSIAYSTTGTTAAATNSLSYTYGTSSSSNNNGRLITANNTSESDSYSYDALGRIISVAKTIGSNTYTVGYAYNSVSALTTLTYPSTRAVATAYDAIGRANQISDGSRTYLTVGGSDYNPAGQLLHFAYGNGVSANFTYNDHMQLASIRYANGSTDLLNLAYSYNQSVGGNTVNNGQIQKITWQPGGTEDTTKTQNYEYDAWYRIKKAFTSDLTANGTWRQEWSYDRFGNMTQQNLTGGLLNAPYSTPSSPNLTVSATSNRITTSGYTYDSAGNLTNDGSNSYTYDAENRLVTFNTGSISTAYVFGTDGLRIKKTVGSNAPTTYVFSGFKVVAEYTGSTPALSQEYVYAGDSLLASLDSSGTPTYRHPDHLSSRVETNASGGTVRTFGHFPYGETWYETGAASRQKFTTYERDSESALDYANYRYYAPRLGRFVTPDILAGGLDAPQSLNRYAYVIADPINHIDALGLTCYPDDPPPGGCPTPPPPPDPNGGTQSPPPPGTCFLVYIDNTYAGNTCDVGNRWITECEARGNHKLSPCSFVNPCAATEGPPSSAVPRTVAVGYEATAAAGTANTGSSASGGGGAMASSDGTTATYTSNGASGRAANGDTVSLVPGIKPAVFGAYFGAGASASVSNGTPGQNRGAFDTFTFNIGWGMWGMGFSVSVADNGTYTAGVNKIGPGIGVAFTVQSTNTTVMTCKKGPS